MLQDLGLKSTGATSIVKRYLYPTKLYKQQYEFIMLRNIKILLITSLSVSFLPVISLSLASSSLLNKSWEASWSDPFVILPSSTISNIYFCAYHTTHQKGQSRQKDSYDIPQSHHTIAWSCDLLRWGLVSNSGMWPW